MCNHLWCEPAEQGQESKEVEDEKEVKRPEDDEQNRRQSELTHPFGARIPYCCRGYRVCACVCVCAV